MYSAAPRKPLQMNSSHSCPFPPMVPFPQVGHLAERPTVTDCTLPCWCRVSPKPMIGEATASCTDVMASDPRRESLAPLASRWLIMPCSGVAPMSTPATTSPAIRAPSTASRPMDARRKAMYTTAKISPIHSPRSSE